MTDRKNAMRRLPVATVPVATVPVAAVLALVLAGCAGSHVGDDWQCPLAQGAVCSSVAAADPAVPETAAAPAGRTPLYRARGGAAEGAIRTAPETGCAAGCGPFAWLARLFNGDDVADGVADGAADSGEPERGAVPGGPPAAETVAAAPAASRDAVPDGLAQDDPAPHDPAGDGLRTPETVGRVWIGPFVDAGGVYREAAYVRIVIEPAGWRLP